jgi:co-chaperonin GroES (HSP10)
MTNYPVSPNGNIFVRIEKQFNDEIQFSSGLKLYQDTTYRPEWHTNLVGKVVSIPSHLGSTIENRGISMEVQVGDTIYFEWAVCANPANKIDYNGETLWMVPYFQVIGVQELFWINPIGGRVLVKPLVEKKEEVTAGGIVLPVMMQSEERKDMGLLIEKGTPKEGQQACLADCGDTVIFPDWARQEHELDGTKYYVVDQELIEAYIPKLVFKKTKKKKKSL